MKKIIFVFLFVFNFAHAEVSISDFSVRGGLGTDISGGIAYGIGGSYIIDFAGNPTEVGILYFGGSFEESTSDTFTYNETTEVTVIAAMANSLFNYNLTSQQRFFILGVGLASVSMDWTEESPDDTSLGTPVGSGSKQSSSGSGGGILFNFGAGYTFGNGVDARAEVPIIVSFEAPGEASKVIPTFMGTVAYHFK